MSNLVSYVDRTGLLHLVWCGVKNVLKFVFYFIFCWKWDQVTKKLDPLFKPNPFIEKLAQWKERRTELAPAFSQHKVFASFYWQWNDGRSKYPDKIYQKNNNKRIGQSSISSHRKFVSPIGPISRRTDEEWTKNNCFKRCKNYIRTFEDCYDIRLIFKI